MQCLGDLERGARPDVIVQVLRVMRRERLELTPAHFDAAVRACVPGGDWRTALQMLDALTAEGLRPSQDAFDSALGACVRAGESRLALCVLAEMPSARAERSAKTYRSALQACTKGGQWQMALTLLQESAAAKLAPDAAFFHATLDTCKANAPWQVVLSLVMDMVSADIRPGQKQQTQVIEAFAKGGAWELALGIFNVADRTRLQGEWVSQQALRACGQGRQWDRALEILRDARRTRGNYNGALTALKGRPEAREVFLDALDDGAYPNLLAKGELTLDVHSMSPAAGVEAVKWWLRDLLPDALRSRVHLPPTLIIVTGRGLHSSFQATEGQVQDAVDALIDRWQLPRAQALFTGRFSTHGERPDGVLEWKRSEGILALDCKRIVKRLLETRRIIDDEDD